MNTMNTKTGRLVGMGILIALVIVLQTFASGFKIANFAPPLSLIPIIIGAILFGELCGAMLGLIFGIVVVVAVLSGAEPFSTLMLNHNPVMTVLICLFKGAAAGYLSGVAYKLLSSKNNLCALIISSIITPIVNTGIFTIGMLTVFYKLVNDTAVSAGANNTITFFFTVFIGINFLIEVIFVAVLVPAISNIISIIKKKNK
ncbi:MAG: ECF transporter S component, partial [Catonella sp.]|uniref:ECF transporter S component n=1 Tax=Catonella sp. TaxID=2382125 RepID=UPI003F9F6FBC